MRPWRAALGRTGHSTWKTARRSTWSRARYSTRPRAQQDPAHACRARGPMGCNRYLYRAPGNGAGGPIRDGLAFDNATLISPACPTASLITALCWASVTRAWTRRRVLGWICLARHSIGTAPRLSRRGGNASTAFDTMGTQLQCTADDTAFLSSRSLVSGDGEIRMQHTVDSRTQCTAKSRTQHTAKSVTGPGS